jgi:hypothetical protein
MPTTSRPASARRPAAYSPPGPSPTAITSASVTIVDPSYRSQRTALWADSLRRSRTSFLKPPGFGAVDAIAGRQASLEDHHRRGWLGQDSPSSSIRAARVGRHRGEARAGVAGWATSPKSQSAVSAGPLVAELLDVLLVRPYSGFHVSDRGCSTAGSPAIAMRAELSWYQPRPRRPARRGSGEAHAPR